MSKIFLLILIFNISLIKSYVINNSNISSIDNNKNDNILNFQYIINFKKYSNYFNHLVFLEKILGKQSYNGWVHISRNNTAFFDYPTDFLLISLPFNTFFFFFKDYIFNLPIKYIDEVKHVSISRSFHSRNLNSYKSNNIFYSRSILSSSTANLIDKLNIKELYDKGYKGQNVKIGVFDTGITHTKYIKNIKERTNWTNERGTFDTVGHGTFISSVIGGVHQSCPGIAPEAEIYSFKVFSSHHTSYTSWFLDAFNYAIHKEIDVINLSIGGPDYLDLPFVEKVDELAANNIILVSAIGNDGPVYGTLNNPADQIDTIGVGGIDYDDHISIFSSRGMTTWELPGGYGRVKPDIVTYSKDIKGLTMNDNCRSLSGTSVASPVVVGLISLLISSMDKKDRRMEPVFVSEKNGHLLSLKYHYPSVFWPFSGYLAVFLTIPSKYSKLNTPTIIKGQIKFSLSNEKQDQENSVLIPITLQAISTPSRKKRLLFDSFHNLFYPTGYFPRDDLNIKDDILDWNGDHVHTNYLQLYKYLRNEGYFIEVLGRDYTCFNSRNYAALLIIDPEEEYFQIEISKLLFDIINYSLHIIVFSDWYNIKVLDNIKFFDSNSNSWWFPQTGGSNIPALNEILRYFGISLGSDILNGNIGFGPHTWKYASGTSILTFPRGGLLLFEDLDEMLPSSASSATFISNFNKNTKKVRRPILGLYQVQSRSGDKTIESGRIAIYGDSNCIDSKRQINNCHILMKNLLEYAINNIIDDNLYNYKVEDYYHTSDGVYPIRNPNSQLNKYSKIFCSNCQPACIDKYNQKNFQKWNETIANLPNPNFINENFKNNSESGIEYTIENYFLFFFIIFSMALLLFLTRKYWYSRII